MTRTHKKRIRSTPTSTKSLSRKRRAEIDVDMTSAYELNQATMTKRAVFKTSDVELGDDLVQTTFLKTLRYLQKGGKIDIMRAFLNRVLSDLIVDEYRKRKMVSLDTLLENGFEPGIDYTDQLIDIFDGKKVILLIDQLPKKYQTVIRMRYVQGLSLKEISVLTKQAQNTIAVQSYRGLKKLKVLETNSHK